MAHIDTPVGEEKAVAEVEEDRVAREHSASMQEAAGEEVVEDLQGLVGAATQERWRSGTLCPAGIPGRVAAAW